MDPNPSSDVADGGANGATDERELRIEAKEESDDERLSVLDEEIGLEAPSDGIGLSPPGPVGGLPQQQQQQQQQQSAAAANSIHRVSFTTSNVAHGDELASRGPGAAGMLQRGRSFSGTGLGGSTSAAVSGGSRGSMLQRGRTLSGSAFMPMMMRRSSDVEFVDTYPELPLPL
jgi:hypothetical protein